MLRSSFGRSLSRNWICVSSPVGDGAGVSVDYEGRAYTFGNTTVLSAVLDRLPPGGSVLDVGCGTGGLLAALPAGTACAGLDVSAAAAQQARRTQAEIFEGDLGPPVPGLDGRHFDVVVCADVLEHLVDPLAGLRRALDWASPGGTVVVSVPNVGYWSARLQVLRGRFPREDWGIFDAGHLHFFTLHELRALLDKSGVSIDEVRSAVPALASAVPLADRLPTWAARRLGPAWQRFGARRPSVFAFQLVAICAVAQ